jgi:hypothetical protein
LPSILVDINNLLIDGYYWGGTTPPRMTPVLVVIALIIAELVIKVGRCPKERVIQ